MNLLRFSIFAAGLISAFPAFALDVEKSMDTPAAPAKVWSTIGDFCGIGQWHPAVAKCALSEADGVAIRDLSLNGGGELKEALVSRDDKAMTYTYKILSGPLPVDHYVSTITVEKAGSGSKIAWKGKFDAKGAPDAKATEVIAGIYESGLKAIVEKAGK